MMVIATLIISMILSILFGLAVWQQYVAFILPFIYLGIASLILLIPPKWNLTKVTALVLCVVLLLSFVYLPTYYTNYMKNDLRGAANYLYDKTNNGDYVIDSTYEFSHYYNHTLDNTKLVTYESVSDLNQLANSTNKIYWVSIWDTEPKNITAIAPSGLEFIDKLIEKYYDTTTLEIGDSNITSWMKNNTNICAKYQYFGPYRSLYIREISPQK